jgi:hypothetical protein
MYSYIYKQSKLWQWMQLWTGIVKNLSGVHVPACRGKLSVPASAREVESRMSSLMPLSLRQALMPFQVRHAGQATRKVQAVMPW